MEMQQECIFCTGLLITWMACIVSLTLTSAALLGVGWRCGCSSLFLLDRTGTVGFFLLSIFGSCSSLIYRLSDFHALKHLTCILVELYFKISSLYVGLFCSRVGENVKDNLVEFSMINFIVGA